MKELNMQLSEILSTPRVVLEGILMALSEHNILHSFDGYDSKDIDSISKQKPQVRGQYMKYLEKQETYQRKLGKKAPNSI